MINPIKSIKKVLTSLYRIIGPSAAQDNDNLSGFKGIGFATILSLVLIAIGYALVSYVV